ncbi:MAG: hypothetical protein ACTSU2_13340 [Promethearchaeota archaeon]
MNTTFNISNCNDIVLNVATNVPVKLEITISSDFHAKKIPKDYNKPKKPFINEPPEKISIKDLLGDLWDEEVEYEAYIPSKNKTIKISNKYLT